MHTISRDSPCYYLISVTRDRLNVFRKEEIKVITCGAVYEARRSGRFGLYAYVIMLEHLHVITASALAPARAEAEPPNSIRRLDGKPKAYRYVLRQSRKTNSATH